MFSTARRFLPQRLQHQLSLLFALLFSASMFVYSHYVAHQQHELALAHLSAQAEALSKGLAISSEEALTTGEVWQLGPMLRQTAEFPGILTVDLTDPGGILLASVVRQGDTTLPGLRTGFSIQVPDTSGVMLIKLTPASPADSEGLEVWVPIGKDSPLGWVRARFSLEQASAAASRFYAASLWSGLLVIGLTIAAFVVFLRRPMRDLQRATEFATQLESASGGQMSIDAGVSDVDALGKALNRASLRLHEQQSALRRSEEHYRMVLESLSEIVFEVSSALTLNFLNSAWEEITQYRREDTIGRSILEFAAPEDHPQLRAAFARSDTVESGLVRDHFRYLTKNGTVRWFEVCIRARRDESGSILGYVGSATDVTARLDAERALQEQLRFVETLVESIPTAIYVKDLAGRFIVLNRAFESMLTVERMHLVGKRIQDLPSATPCLASLRQLHEFELGQAESDELRLLDWRGQGLNVLCHQSSLGSGSGSQGGFIVSITDISVRKQAEEQMRAARDAAEAASRAKSDFLANISHEIRTPMNAILGMTELALDTSLSAEQHEYISLVKTSADGLLSVLNDVLDFSKIEAGQLSFDSAPFRLEECVASAVRTLRARADEKKLSLDLAIAPEIPGTLLGDAGRLRQILLNLIANAIKFTMQGEVHIAVECLERKENTTCLRFAVSDTGIGIDPEHHDRIFEAFTQADSSISRQAGGTGLGLSISSRLVKGMGGKIWLESEPARGSTFFFTAVFEIASAQALPPVKTKGQLTPSATPLKLLLAEDNPVNQTLATRLLHKLGHSVDVVSNGAEAVDATAAIAYDAILMDVQMPKMSGLDASRAIRAQEAGAGKPNIPIIAMTAHAMAEDRQRCLDAGMNAYITKPVITDALIAELARIKPRNMRDAGAAPWPVSVTVAAEFAQVTPEKGDSMFNRAWMLDQIGGDVELMHEVATIFLSDCERLRESLRQDIAAADLPALQSSAHAIKGAVGNFGASAAVATALALEQAAKNGQVEGITALHLRLEGQLEALVSALQLELQQK